MYKEKDVIMYANGGICVIEEICNPDFLDTDDKYYKMQSISESNGTLYVRVDNTSAKLRAIISEKEAEKLLDDVPMMVPIYNANDKVREREYNDIYKSCVCQQALCMMKGLYKEKKSKSESGKKLSMNDDRNFARISKILYLEFAYALKISVEQAENKIENMLML